MLMRVLGLSFRLRGNGWGGKVLCSELTWVDVLSFCDLVKENSGLRLAKKFCMRYETRIDLKKVEMCRTKKLAKIGRQKKREAMNAVKV